MMSGRGRAAISLQPSAAAIVARRKARFLTEDLGKVARTGIAHVHADRDDRAIGFADKSARFRYAHADEILGRRQARRSFELAAEMRNAHGGRLGIAAKVERLCQIGLHEVGDPAEAKRGYRTTATTGL